MTSPDTKPAKADASAVEVPITREMAMLLAEIGRQAAQACGLPDAALQSSSSAEAELRALLSSAKATIALLMATEVDLRDRIKVLEEALRPILDFVQINDTDTMSRLRPDNEVLAIASGSWTSETYLTLGHLRAIDAALARHDTATQKIAQEVSE